MRRCPVESPFDLARRCASIWMYRYAISVAVVAPPLIIPMFVYEIPIIRTIPTTKIAIAVLSAIAGFIGLVALEFTVALRPERDQEEQYDEAELQVLFVVAIILGLFLGTPGWLLGSSVTAFAAASLLEFAMHTNKTRLVHSIDGELRHAIHEATLGYPSPHKIKEHIVRIRTTLDERRLRYIFVTRPTEFRSELTWVNTFYETLEHVYRQLDRHIISSEPLDVAALRQTLRELTQFGNRDPRHDRPIEMGTQIHETHWRGAVHLNHCLIRYFVLGMFSIPFACFAR